jgi:predicted permease
MATLGQDIRYALRQLRKSPAFALTAIVTLGLGIGVNAAMFSVIQQVLLRPLPFANQSRLVAINHGQLSNGASTFSLPDVRDYRARSHSLEAMAWYTFALPTLGGTGDPEVVPQLVTSPNFFSLLGVHPAMGRDFSPEDSKPGRDHVLILSNGAWQKFYHGDRGILGRVVPIDGVPYTVIGILPRGVTFPVGADTGIFSPLDSSSKGLQDRSNAALEIIGLLRPGVTPAQAQAELNGIHQQMEKAYPKDEDANPLQVESYRDSITRGTRPAMFALDWAVLAVWLIACANVAGLVLTRTNARRREIAIRGALGAQRGRIAAQFLTESLLLALAGAAAGLGVAALALHLLGKYLADKVLFGKDIHINLEVFAFLLAASCISAVIFGLLPAWHASGVPAQEGLREGTAAAGTSRRQALWRDGLVVLEITLTLALLIAAGLMMRTLLSLRDADMGFDANHVVTGSIFMPARSDWWAFNGSDKGQPNMVTAFFDPLEQKLSAIPGAEAAGFTTVRPLNTNFNFNASVTIRNRPKLPSSKEPNAEVRASTAGYFKAMGIRLLQGRFFNSADGPDAPIAILINEALAKKAFPHENPIGQQIEVGNKGPREWGTVVGVIENSRQHTPGQAPQPEIDLNLAQLIPTDPLYPILATFHMDLAVRAYQAPASIEDTIRRDVHELEPTIAVQDLEPMQEVVNNSLVGQTLAARLLGIFGLAALLIAVAGIYGLLAYSVSQRTRELGVRIALGAQKNNIVWLVLRHALVLLGIGVGVGLVVAWAASGVMRSFLYGARGWDAATVLLVVLTLGLCGLAASYIPARRAAGVDPVEALRTE